MKTIYTAGGILNKGFVGQISYTVCLDREYSEMDIFFNFDKQHYTEITKEIREDFIAACKGKYDSEIETEEQIINAIQGMKTEIHTIATMDDNFIGGIHKQLTERHMHYSPDYTSEGCLPQESLHGVIRLTLVVFNVIQDDTHYEVTLSVNEDREGGSHV